MMFRALTVSVLAFSAVACSGQEWARKMFKETSHDFGTVARGAKTEFVFELSNIYVDDVQISSVRSSCGCTTPRIEKALLKTYDKGGIVAAFNTPSFLGRKGATITVTFDKPYRAEVQLQVTGYIRGDVTFEPGSIQFGSVEQGTPAEARSALTFMGRSDWKITAVQCSNPHITGEVVPAPRGSGQVGYQLVVRLDGAAPPGNLHEHLLLLTNDSRPVQIPLAIEGRVLSAISVSPASLFMGVVPPGEKVTKKLVVKGNKPFRILSIRCDDPSFSFEPTDDGPKTVHLVPVTFLAGESAGKVAKTIRIETDLGETKPELSAFAVVGAP